VKSYYEHAGLTIYHGDCRDVLPELEAMDLVLTDPPYGTGWSRGGGNDPNGGPHPFHRRIETALWDVWDPSWIKLCKAAAWRIFFPSFALQDLSELVGKGLPLYWKKTNPAPLGATREPIFAFPIPWELDQWEFEAYNGDAPLHPCQKPMPVLNWLISNVEAGTILDPFMGSGSTLRSAKDLGCKAIGIEVEERYCEIAAKRLSQEVFPF
jgi:DNA modification methylase